MSKLFDKDGNVTSGFYNRPDIKGIEPLIKDLVNNLAKEGTPIVEIRAVKSLVDNIVDFSFARAISEMRDKQVAMNESPTQILESIKDEFAARYNGKLILTHEIDGSMIIVDAWYVPGKRSSMLFVIIPTYKHGEFPYPVTVSPAWIGNEWSPVMEQTVCSPLELRDALTKIFNLESIQAEIKNLQNEENS